MNEIQRSKLLEIVEEAGILLRQLDDLTDEIEDGAIAVFLKAEAIHLDTVIDSLREVIP
jgi:hypothetical protein